MKQSLTLSIAASLIASPALAAGDAFFSLSNTDFVVSIGFVLFLAVLVYFNIPSLLMGMLDKRADGIRSELDEARALREEAQALLASYERKSNEVQEQADRIVAHAREESELAAEQAKADLQKSIDRRIATAESQLASAQTAAIKEVRDTAATYAVAAARQVLAEQMTDDAANAMIDNSIEQVGARLH